MHGSPTRVEKAARKTADGSVALFASLFIVGFVESGIFRENHLPSQKKSLTMMSPAARIKTATITFTSPRKKITSKMLTSPSM
ncbi:hypothetical protein ES705_50147 [subsurface metagenome]